MDHFSGRDEKEVDAMIDMKSIRKVYSMGKIEVAALKGVDLVIGEN